MTTFFISCVVNLTLRFEEELLARLGPGDRTSPEQAGTNDELLIHRRGVSNETFVMNRVPVKCTVEFHGYRQAATFDVAFKYRELPVDPRTIRSAVVEIHMGQVAPFEFGAGASGQTTDRAQPLSVLNTRDSSGRVREDTLMLKGPVDEWDVSMSDTEAEVHLRGRDVRGLLLDSPLTSPNDTPKSRVLNRLDTRLPIDELVRQILNEHGRLRDLAVVTDPAEWENSRVPSPMGAGDVARHRQGARGGGGATGSNGLNYWDLIVQYCTLVGAVPYMLGTRLYIRPARSLFGADVTSANRLGRSEGTGRRATSDFSLVYGRDLQKMSLKRKYAGNNKPRRIRAVAINPHPAARRDSRTLVAIYPPLRTPRSARAHKAGVTHVSVSGNEEVGEIQTVSFPGVTSKERLELLAKSLYEQLGRQEIEGQFETRVMAINRGADVVSMLQMRPGNTVELVQTSATSMLGDAISTTFRAMQTAPFENVVQDVTRMVRDPNLAAAIVGTVRGQVMGLLRYFRVSSVRFAWQNGKSLDIEGDFQNYWVIRQNVDPTDNERIRHTSHIPRGTPGAREGQHAAPRAPAAPAPVGASSPAESAPAGSGTPSVADSVRGGIFDPALSGGTRLPDPAPSGVEAPGSVADAVRRGIFGGS